MLYLLLQCRNTEIHLHTPTNNDQMTTTFVCLGDVGQGIFFTMVPGIHLHQMNYRMKV